ncbi:MAG: peptidylprolyl isomerase [Phycisphaerales bacterium]|nr:peptidylprolyl isomerase [Phycisphaerales bacterium]
MTQDAENKRCRLIGGIFVGGACAVIGLSGCGQVSSTAGPLALSDFSNQSRAVDQQPSASEASAVLVEAGLTAPPPAPAHPAQDSDRGAFFDVDARPGQAVVVDSLIGQVNGRPIYADEVLAPVMDRLVATYEDQPYGVFQQQLTTLVIQQLQAVVVNELIVAESRASMSTAQQGGLLAFMNQLREDAVRKRGGVSREAERQLLEEEGKTIDEYLDAEKQKLLIEEVLRDKVAPHTIVSWRDIERSYRARIHEFQPPATVTLGRIRLRTAGNEPQITLLSSELKAGEPFEVVARQAGMAEDGVWETFDLPADGNLEDLPLADFYKPHIKGLGPGEVTEAFTRGTWTLWVSVIDITQPEQRSLDDSDVQRLLQQQISMSRAQEAESRFIGQVLQRGIYDDISMMGERAVAIAASRFPPK